MNENTEDPTGRPDETPASTPRSTPAPADAAATPAQDTAAASASWPAPTEPATPGPAAPGQPGPAWAAPADVFGRPVSAHPMDAPAAPKRMRKGLRNGLIAGASALALLLSFGTGTAFGYLADLGQSTAAGDSSPQDPGAFGPDHGRPGMQQGPSSPQGPRSGADGTSVTSPEASAEQKNGVVIIDSALSYHNATGAGTGLILSSDGTILTNTHVVRGATKIRVTVPSTGQAYTAKVVGTDATNDVAVLKLEGASDLTPAKIDTGTVAVGDAVTGVGNGGGTGTLTAAAGKVAALDQTITTQPEGASAGETLTGLIQTDANIVPGDSGGPLLDAQNEVVGIDTAASSGSPQVAGFAIPIDRALNIAKQIQSGVESGTVKIGYPAFLGVLLADKPGKVAGAPVAGVVEGSGSAQAGIGQGDVITSVDGKPVASASELSTAIAAHKPGQKVKLGWTAASGAAKTGTVALGEGPVS